MRISMILGLLILAGCANKEAQFDVEPPHTRYVFHPAYNYHGVEVNDGRNWFLGRNKGLAGNDSAKLDLDTASLGAFFNNSKTENEIKTAMQNKEADKLEKSLSMKVKEPASNIKPKFNAVTNKVAASCANPEVDHSDRSEWLIHFDSNKSLPNDFHRFEPEFQKVKPYKVVVTGYTDDKGSDTFNLKLSEKRAKKTQRLLSQIWPEAEFQTVWNGECPRLVLNTDEKSRALNRRVQIHAYTTPLTSEEPTI